MDECIFPIHLPRMNMGNLDGLSLTKTESWSMAGSRAKMGNGITSIQFLMEI